MLKYIRTNRRKLTFEINFFDKFLFQNPPTLAASNFKLKGRLHVKAFKLCIICY